MRYILDTCVFSEVARFRPAEAVISWMDRHLAVSFLTSPVVMELEKGLYEVGDLRRREHLRESLGHVLRRFPPGQSFVFDDVAAAEAARAIGEGRDSGHPIGIIDAQIVGIAAAMRCAIATRDADFQSRGVEVVNPWTE